MLVNSNLWLMTVGVLAGLIVDLFRINSTTNVDKTVFAVFITLSIALWAVAVLIWIKATVASIAAIHSVPVSDIAWCVSGFPAFLLVGLWGYASIRIATA